MNEEKKQSNFDKMLELKGRTFFFSSNTEHLTEEQILMAVSHSSILHWAYILHDKDNYTLADLSQQQERIENCKKLGKEYKGKIITEKDIGKHKPNHFHIAIRTRRETPLKIKTIAKWFNLEPFMIDIPKGNKEKDAFIDCCRYLTHEELKQKQLGKQLYSYDKVKHSTNFDFETEMKKINEIQERYGSAISKEQAYFRMVSEGFKTPKEIYYLDEDFYNNNLNKINQLRNDYLENRAELPLARLNYYVEGVSGKGKSELVEALARALNPCIDDKDCFFYAKKGNFPFDNYNGQKVIIWDDFAPQDILKSCGGMTGFYNVFDKPKHILQDKKGSHTKLLNIYNIITHTTDYRTYLDALNGKYTYTKNVYNADDKKFEKVEIETDIKSEGSYRRFPIILKINKDDFDIYLNNGWLDDNADFKEYMFYQNVRGSMKRIAEMCGGDLTLRNQIQSKVVEPIKQISTNIYEKRTKKNHTKEELEKILNETKDYGSITEKKNEIEEMNKLIQKEKDSVLIKEEKLRLENLKKKYAIEDDLPF